MKVVPPGEEAKPVEVAKNDSANTDNLINSNQNVYADNTDDDNFFDDFFADE